MIAVKDPQMPIEPKSNTHLEKEKRIKKEVTRLKSLYKELDNNIKKLVETLIKNAAFTAITLEDLQETINKNGVTSKYKNGENQYGEKESSEVKIYNTMIKNHASIMKQLSDLLPKGKAPEQDDGFEQFVESKNEKTE